MNYKQTGSKVTVPQGKTVLNIEVFSSDIIRVNYALLGSKKRQSLVVTMKPEVSEVSVEETVHGLEVQTDNIRVVVDKNSLGVRFHELSGPVLSEKPGTRLVMPAVVSKEKTFHAGVGFTRLPNEGIYGLGQYEEGFMNYKNCDVLMIQANRVIVNPFLVSSRGYGILWDNYSESKFHAGEKDFSFWSEVADGIDYYFVHGGSMDGA
ncbi:MAG: DUF4968 domain-containing protein, partial [Spirochaetia bacterium]|nr:DUF4968 domain-containing protein [Spirochaetia bacterium]